jgi:hypothetical protein
MFSKSVSKENLVTLIDHNDWPMGVVTFNLCMFNSMFNGWGWRNNLLVRDRH